MDIALRQNIQDDALAFIRQHGIDMQLPALLAFTEVLFAHPVDVSVNEPDPGEPQHLILKVAVPPNGTPKDILRLESEWHDKAIELLDDKINAVTLVVQFK
jgi:hypothetical protein